MIAPAKALAGVDAIGLDAEAMRLFLGENAQRVYRL
jgi:predicted TIM-barrel fold metal-dependent hydrolase